MLEVNFYDDVDDSLLKFAVIISKASGKWVFCKHKERDTYEIPGGHREEGESILDTAKRELREETGAIDFKINPICVYSVKGKTRVNKNANDESYGMLYIADIYSFEEIHSEIEKIILTDGLVDNWTYPLIQPKLIQEAQKRGFSTWKPFIKNVWFRKHFMKFVYSLQVVLILMSTMLGVWNFANWIIKASVFILVFIVHELLHISVVYNIGDISLTHSGIFFWLNSNATMSKKRFWLFMTLPLLVLTIIPMFFLPLTDGFVFELLRYIVCINAIIAGSDIINSILITMKSTNAKFCGGYYID